jgi:regulatory protein
MGSRTRPKKLDAEELWNQALKLLGQRSYSQAELRRKLALRASTPGDVQATVDKLREYGLINDAKFSETFAQARVQTGSFGRQRVLRDLLVKRVSPRVASTAVDQAFAGQDERSLVDAFLDRKYRGQNLSELLKEEKKLASVFRRLRTAGFSTAVILPALKARAGSVADEWAEVEEPSDSEPD